MWNVTSAPYSRRILLPVIRVQCEQLSFSVFGNLCSYAKSAAGPFLVRRFPPAAVLAVLAVLADAGRFRKYRSAFLLVWSDGSRCSAQQAGKTAARLYRQQ